MRCIGSIYIILIAMLTISLIPTPGSMEAEGAGGSFGGGSGTASDPYIIEDVDDLQNMASDLDAHYALKKDINAVVTKTWNAGAGFVPVGSYPDHFNGTLDGRNYTISGLFIDRPSSDLVGLFGYVQSPFLVKNLGMVDIDFTGDESVGGIVGNMVYGSVVNCHTSGNVVGTQRVGGITGYTQGLVSNSYSTMNVEGDYYVGGIVGYQNSGSMERCYSTGSISGTGSIGGLAGLNSGRVSNSHYNIESVLINGGNHLTAGGLYDDQYQDWMYSGMSLNISDYPSSFTKKGEHYDIGNAEGIRDLLMFADVRDLKFRLSADIDLTSEPGLYIPYFEASEFDGANHTISNLHIDEGSATNIGLLGRIYWYVNIMNIRVDNFDITGYGSVGGLIGSQVGGSVSNCFASGDVSGRGSTGGLIGGGTYLNVEKCYTSGVVSGTTEFSNYIGGLVGYLNGYTVHDCHSACDMTGTGDSTGGLIGYLNYGEITNCSATGSVAEGRDYMGGLIGKNHGDLSGCFATGTVSGNGWGIGGLIGYNEYGRVFNCYSTGKVTGTDNAVGGLAGNNLGSITSCYSTGNVSGSGTYFGGHVGINSGTISRCFWDMETSGRSSSDGGVGKTTVEMKTENTFTDEGWDFNSTWHILGGVTYPFLGWQDAGAPIADAGPDQITYLGPDGKVNVVLDGTGSEDDLAILNYTWNFEHEGSEVMLYGPEVEYVFRVHGIYEVTLTLTDISGNFGTDTTIVAVFDNTDPIADAGPDRTVDEGTVVTFDGGASSDNAGIVDYEWTFMDDGPVSLKGVGPNYRFDHPGSFIVTLKVIDAAANSDMDTLTVTVIDTTYPVANAGPDQTVDEGILVTFYGNESSDNVGIVNWTWSFTDDIPIEIYGVTPNHLFLGPGTFLVILNVSDDVGNWDLDNMTVIVNDITSPVADAGQDQTVDEGAMVMFNGNGSTDNVGVTNWTWCFYDIDEVIIHGVNVTYRFEDPGTYIVTLNVSDAAGNWHIDTVMVTVQDTTDPVANAGEDMTVAVGSVVKLNGSLSTDNGGIDKYSWSFSYDGDDRILDGELVSFTFSKGGTYEIVLTVIDMDNNTNEDEVIVTVIDTGKVKGIVLDEDGNPVQDSSIEITASDGKTYTTTTGPDGSFSIDIPYGPYVWKITKSGYETIIGTDSIGPMEEKSIDLSENPLVKERKDQDTSLFCFIVIVAVAVIILIMVFMVLVSVRRKGQKDTGRWGEE